MKKITNTTILDPLLCDRTVSVYHREGLTRRVLEGVHFALTQERTTNLGRSQDYGEFLLVIPGEDPIAPGDRVLPDMGPENLPVGSKAMTVLSARKCYLMGQVSHTEARGR